MDTGPTSERSNRSINTQTCRLSSAAPRRSSEQSNGHKAKNHPGSSDKAITSQLGQYLSSEPRTSPRPNSQCSYRPSSRPSSGHVRIAHQPSQGRPTFFTRTPRHGAPLHALTRPINSPKQIQSLDRSSFLTGRLVRATLPDQTWSNPLSTSIERTNSQPPGRDPLVRAQT